MSPDESTQLRTDLAVAYEFINRHSTFLLTEARCTINDVRGALGAHACPPQYVSPTDDEVDALLAQHGLVIPRKARRQL